jgi:hypothetical protein
VVVAVVVAGVCLPVLLLVWRARSARVVTAGALTAAGAARHRVVTQLEPAQVQGQGLRREAASLNENAGDMPCC